jgi:hypothetical protein
MKTFRYWPNRFNLTLPSKVIPSASYIDGAEMGQYLKFGRSRSRLVVALVETFHINDVTVGEYILEVHRRDGQRH